MNPLRRRQRRARPKRRPARGRWEAGWRPRGRRGRGRRERPSRGRRTCFPRRDRRRGSCPRSRCRRTSRDWRRCATSPDISPCCCSGKLDCTTLTEGVSITPRPRPIRSSPGAKATARDEAPTRASKSRDPGDGDHEARHDQGLLRAPLGEPLRGQRRDQDADRRRREDDARLDGVVAADGLEEDGDDERRPHQQQPLDVLSDKPEVRRAVLEQSRGQQRFLARSLASADVQEEPDEEGGAGRQQHRHQREVAVGLEDPEDHEEHADRRQDRSERVEGTRRVRRRSDPRSGG